MVTIDKLMKNENFTLIGSRGIGLDGDDYDFVVNIDNLTDEVDYGQCMNLCNYVNVLPLGNSMLINLQTEKGENIDILAYEDNKDISAIKLAVQTIKMSVESSNYYYDFYEIKDNRVSVFEFLYKGYRDGFIKVSNYEQDALPLL